MVVGAWVCSCHDELKIKCCRVVLLLVRIGVGYVVLPVTSMQLLPVAICLLHWISLHG
ncbi:hypothetical protein PAHAL_3G016600 [Panicum hallii]|uniref:Uncharacterized protein n=1 Tax=Panicum hallii TaxID=206008 RepID=A0A2T8KGP1_9POAL|nr:hypothetical protein PAHAL_3G016600 [Panicum hallii]